MKYRCFPFTHHKRDNSHFLVVAFPLCYPVVVFPQWSWAPRCGTYLSVGRPQLRKVARDSSRLSPQSWVEPPPEAPHHRHNNSKKDPELGGGNSLPQCHCTKPSGQNSSKHCRQPAKLSSNPNVGRMPAESSPPSPTGPSPHILLSTSASCSSAASTCPCHCLHALVDAVALLTLWATIPRPVRNPGSGGARGASTRSDLPRSGCPGDHQHEGGRLEHPQRPPFG